MEEKVKSYRDELTGFGKALAKMANTEAVAIWEELKVSRAKELELAIEKEGLAVCSKTDEHILQSLQAREAEEKGDSNLTDPEMGIFPKSEVRYLYETRVRPDVTTEEIQILCPSHFPKYPNLNYGHPHRYEGERREVFKRDDGRLIIPDLLISEDVTDVPITKIYLLGEEFYTRFGIAPLPPRSQ